MATEREFELKGKRVAVTGAGGFIGLAICRRLAAEGAQVQGLDVDPAATERVGGAGASFVEADVTDAEALGPALDGVDAAIHTAAYVREWGEMAEFVRVNVGGTAKVAAAARAAGVRLLHLSSVVAYGHESAFDQDETAYRRVCGNPYVDTKSASELVALRGGAIVIRPGDVYGPRSIPWTLRIIEMAKAGQLVVTAGGGLMWPVYIDDLVDGVVCGLRRGNPGRVYTCWSGEPVSFEDYFNEYARMAGKPPARTMPLALGNAAALGAELFSKATGRPPPFNRFSVSYIARPGTASNERARSELGWEPKTDLAEGISRTEEWLRAEGLV